MILSFLCCCNYLKMEAKLILRFWLLLHLLHFSGVFFRAKIKTTGKTVDFILFH